MFYVVIEHALKGVSLVGPFDHEEDARAWANDNLYVWRIATLTAPKDYHNN